MCRLHSKYVCLREIKVIDNIKDTSLLQSTLFFVNYDSVLFYSAGPWAQFYKKIYGRNL
jgi:hypothetical protein